MEEIGERVACSTAIGRGHRRQSRDATGQVRGLHDAVEEIGSVVALIREIAERTKLLAPNATMEKIDRTSTAVAAAVERQNATTREISRSAETGAKANQTVFDATAQVKWVARETGVSAHQAVALTEKLSRQAGVLSAQVTEFLRKVRCA